MEISLVKDIATVFALLLSIAATVYAWMTARSKVNEEHLKNVDNKLANQDRRIQAVEGDIKHMPAKDDVLGLKIAMAELRGEFGRLAESNSGAVRSLRRIEEYLMKEKS